MAYQAKTLIPLLIKHYEEAIKDANKFKTKDAILNLAELRNVHFGVCNCAKEVFKTHIFHARWVKERQKVHAYWDKIPLDHGGDREEILRRLQVRLNILKKVLKERYDEKENTGRNTAGAGRKKASKA